MKLTYGCTTEAYYWLQFDAYTSAPRDQTANGHGNSSLVPTYLQLDTQARVIRLETFSKVSHRPAIGEWQEIHTDRILSQTIAPGLRLGFFVASPLFVERLIRATEVGTQAPSGWSQAIVLELLKKWSSEGYIKWLRSVKDAYTTRRDWMVCLPGSSLATVHKLMRDGLMLKACSAMRFYVSLTLMPRKTRREA